MTSPERAAPWQDWLTESGNVGTLLAEGGFECVEVSEHRSRWTFTIDEFLAGWGGDARYRRQVVGPQRWNDYIERASAALLEHLAGPDGPRTQYRPRWRR